MTRSPTPSPNRISVAALVIEAIFVGSAGIVTSVPSSSVRVSGQAGAAVGEAVGSGVGCDVGVATGDGEASATAVGLAVAAGDEQAARTAASRSSSRAGNGVGRRRTVARERASTGTPDAGRNKKQRTPRFGIEGGVRQWIARCA